MLILKALRDPPRRLYMIKGEHNVVIKQVKFNVK